MRDNVRDHHRARCWQRTALAPARRAAAGFTLIEALVGLAVMALFFTMIGSILVSVLNTQDQVSRSLGRERIGAAILELIGRDLQGVYAYEINGAFRGTDRSQEDRLEFLTTRPPSFEDPEEAEEAAAAEEEEEAAGFSSNQQQPLRLTKVGYFVKPSSQAAGLQALFRYEAPYALPLPTPPSGGSGSATRTTESPFEDLGDDDDVHVFEVFDRVAAFDVRFLDGDGQWQESWKEDVLLPAAIEVTVQVIPDIAQPITGYESDFERLQRGTYRATYGLTIKLPEPETK